MRNDKRFTAFIIIGIFGSLIAGLALIIAGGSTFNFSLVIAGIIVLVGGILLTVVIITIVTVLRNPHILDSEPVHIVGEPKKPVEIPSQPERTVWKLMDKEDAFTAELEQSGREDLLKQYKAEAEIIWERYTGDEWDENLRQIDELIDKYKELE